MELKATAKLGELLGMADKKALYEKKAEYLQQAIQEQCWDERDGIFYNVDTNLLPIDKTQKLHSGCPRHWMTLLQRIEVWACFMPMWAGIATPEQAERMVKEHLLNEKTFYAPYGVRTLSKMEKMYAIIKSGNPSCWLGPIWGVSNYMVFDGLCRYGYKEAAKELDCLMMDCTMGNGSWVHHMGFAENKKLKQEMLSMGIVSETTKFVITHITHNHCGSHEEIEKEFQSTGILVAYDGMKLEV